MRRILLLFAMVVVISTLSMAAHAVQPLGKSWDGYDLAKLDEYGDYPSLACRVLYPTMTKDEADICGLSAMALNHLRREGDIVKGTILKFRDTRIPLNSGHVQKSASDKKPQIPGQDKNQNKAPTAFVPADTISSNQTLNTVDNEFWPNLLKSTQYLWVTGLVVCLLVALLVLMLQTISHWTGRRMIIREKQKEIDGLRVQVKNLQTGLSTSNDAIREYQRRITELEKEIYRLKNPQPALKAA